MLIDKINIRSKSLNRLRSYLLYEDKKWLAKVDENVRLLKMSLTYLKLLDWQKKQVEQLKKLRRFWHNILSQKIMT